MVYVWDSKVIFENLTKLEKIYYISIKSIRMSIFSSLIVLPIFIIYNKKLRITSKYNNLGI